MNVKISPCIPNGEIEAISSKSAAHRILICSAFADAQTVIRCDNINKDISATADCLSALGANIEYKPPFFYVTPIKKLPKRAILECNESGSTLRFILPIVSALNIEGEFRMNGRLPNRPLSPLYELLVSSGACLTPQGSNPLISTGGLSGDGEYKIRGDVSSQFISGLLFALTFSGLGGKIIIEGKTESAPYIDMTVNALSLFGAAPTKTTDGYLITSGAKLISPQSLDIEGDWSNAAFPLCMGVLSHGEITLTKLGADSKQGDMQILSILRRFGADITEHSGRYTVTGTKKLVGTDIDATQIPDLVPVLATVASVASGTTRIYGASRLRLKESDRLETVCQMLSALGADICISDDGLVINGKAHLTGGVVDSCNDHRIAMSAAVAAVACSSDVIITGAECASKSYPDFWTDIKDRLGMNVEFC